MSNKRHAVDSPAMTPYEQSPEDKCRELKARIAGHEAALSALRRFLDADVAQYERMIRDIEEELDMLRIELERLCRAPGHKNQGVVDE